ncbi:hypothetical protein J2T17_006336 [Paenibacillus mucilaginosus]|uniref:hypothetical protein n=1 Tax=Paenibacillus mucilaginosus TaxID=61624 RepID=UPI003D20D8E1
MGDHQESFWLLMSVCATFVLMSLFKHIREGDQLGAAFDVALLAAVVLLIVGDYIQQPDVQYIGVGLTAF